MNGNELEWILFISKSKRGTSTHTIPIVYRSTCDESFRNSNQIILCSPILGNLLPNPAPADNKPKQQSSQKANNKSSFRPSNPVFDNTDRSVNMVGDNDVSSQTDRKYYSVGDKNKMMSNHIAMQQQQQQKQSQNQYQFTPEDIKFDNKHYKYLKYTAMKTPLNKTPAVASDSTTDSVKFEDKHKYRTFNENKSNKIAKYQMATGGSGSSGSSSSSKGSTVPAECKAQQLTAIGNRLLDWFSVIMADSKKRRQHSQKPKGNLRGNLLNFTCQFAIL